MRYLIVLIVGLSSLGLLSLVNNGNTPCENCPGPGDEKKKPKDTAKAVVSYGNDYLFETNVNFKDLNIYERVDSLIRLDSITESIKKEIAFYKTVANKSQGEIYEMVDSLFELDSIPFALINQINLYVAMMPERIELPAEFEVVKEDGSPYPANAYYHFWSNKHSWYYPDSIHAKDSTLVLVLADEKKGMQYSHPLCQKTIRRYYGTVTSPYGWRDGKAHNGVDLELHHYDSILNMFDGKVRVARTMGGFGRVVIVRHYNGLESLYAHMSKIRVHEGDTVKAGQLLGHGGQTGNATGTHLHMEVRFKGLPVNPAHIISFQDNELYSDTLILKKYKHQYIAYPYGKEFHIVTKRDSPYRIAKRYGMTTAALCELNGITTSTKLLVGQKIKIQQ